MIEVACLSLTLLIGISIIVSTLRTGISPMPSSAKVRREMVAHINADINVSHIADLGSGWGHLAITLAKAYPEVKVTGFEVSFFPWLVSVLWVKLTHLENVTFRRTNFLVTDLAPYQIYCCYLFPAGMQKLSHKLQQQKLNQQNIASSPRQLVSNTFALPDHQPTNMTVVADLYRTKIYRYDV
ncbi:methyltransferase [Shewanella surugensis]|uniref:Class I SAM-dependent methyltransferase n=1 Tax=Shewanella surugensis TaxID=212020 RepID=A0ABT0L784_9GAMM|nr:methyltransferase [Shewanella surugensis]MCL1123548.1 class I SAM-dependent methyltransferase [Shewanella surugensis]